MFSKILIPLDGSTTAESALPYAGVVAEALKIPLELLAVLDISAAAAHVAASKARYLGELIEEAERSNERYLRRVALRMGNVESRCVVERGRPADIIVARAAEQEGTLTAMASHGRTGLNRWLLGSVAEKVLRRSTRPLLLVRGESKGAAAPESALKSLIVPLDGSALAESVLPAAETLARCFKAEVVLYRAYELPATAYYGKEDHLPDYEAMKEKLREGAQQYLDARLAALKSRGWSEVRTALSEGPAASEIIRYGATQGDSMIAMCTHGRSGVKRLWLGSVTEKVVRHSSSPIFITRANSDGG